MLPPADADALDDLPADPPSRPGRVPGYVELHVRVRFAYGRYFADPRNDAARAFALACRTATLTGRYLRYARRMGCRLVETAGRTDLLARAVHYRG